MHLSLENWIVQPQTVSKDAFSLLRAVWKAFAKMTDGNLLSTISNIIMKNSEKSITFYKIFEKY
jgi:hypothetical protein